MPLQLPGSLVSTEWLAQHRDDPALRIVDASWYLPTMKRDPGLEFDAGHIPGAIFWDLDRLSAAGPLPHMLASQEKTERDLGALGIGNEHIVVVYDASATNLSAPRVWWTLKVWGHEQVAVLDGGLGAWTREGRPLQSGSAAPRRAVFRAQRRPELVKDFEQVLAAVGSGGAVVDARATGRFEGREPEPRPGLTAGHMPGANNLPYGSLVRADGTMLPPAEVRQRFQDAGVDLAGPVILCCGSGVSACALALGLDLIGHRRYSVYDGSWAEWGGRPDAPIASGPA